MNQDENNEIVIDLGDFFDSIFREIKKRKVFLLVVILLCIVSVVGVTFVRHQTTYTSKALFIASSEETENIYLMGEDKDDDLIETFNKLMQSEIMNNIILETLEVKKVPGSIALSRINNTNLIELQVTSTDKNDAYDVVNCILNNYHRVTDRVMSDVNLSILDTPQIAEEADPGPNYLKRILLGCGIGIILCLGFVSLLAFFRNTIKSGEDVDKKLHLKNLAKIPDLNYKRKVPVKHSMLLLDNPRLNHSIKKAFYDIRNKIKQQHNNKGSRIFIVTSSFPGEGKTLVSVNSALALANGKDKTILVDLDLRNPSVGPSLGVTDLEKGVGDYFNGAANLEDLIEKNARGNLDILYGNMSYKAATEMLTGDKLENLFLELRGMYDYIIVDLPPIHVMDDACLVASQADSAIIVIKQDFAKTKDILDAIEELNKKIDTIIGTVINGVEPTIFSAEDVKYGYGYGYGYGRGYGYGYGIQSESNRD